MYSMRLILYNSLLIHINSSPLYIDSSRHDTHFIYIPPKPPKTGTSCPQTIPSTVYTLSTRLPAFCLMPRSPVTSTYSIAYRHACLARLVVSPRLDFPYTCSIALLQVLLPLHVSSCRRLDSLASSRRLDSPRPSARARAGEMGGTRACARGYIRVIYLSRYQ